MAIERQHWRCYRTGLLLLDEGGLQYPKPPFKGASWRAEYRSFPENINFPSKAEVVIYAPTQPAAQRALNSIINSLELYSGQPLTPFGGVSHLAYDSEEEPDQDQYYSTPGIPAACFIAAKVARRKAYIYSLAKYHFSVSLYNQCAIDQHPDWGCFSPISQSPDDHIVFCHAVISAYSILEELGLEVRATSKTPSVIDGEWNPVVKENLEARLRGAGINLEEKILWTLRGPKRKLERLKEIPADDRTKWASGMVRDAEVDLVDAIAFTSWLRSKVSSHKTKDTTSSISPYDVLNAQHLARRLILEHLGVWRFYETLVPAAENNSSVRYFLEL